MTYNSGSVPVVHAAGVQLTVNYSINLSCIK